MEAKKSKCANPYILALESCGIMRRFQNLSQNLNRMTFDPFLAKNCENGKIVYFASFPIKKAGQMLSDLNSETSFGILSSFNKFLTLICKDLHILTFWPPIVISKVLITLWAIKTNISGKTNYTTLISEKKKTHQNRGLTWRS